MSKDLLNTLKKRILIYDGAMGTMLQREGLVPGACPEEWNLKNQDKVLSVHKAYVKAGACIVETNTFGGNRLSLRKYGLENKLKEINVNGVKIAKKCGSFTAASVGPLPEMVSPLGKLSYDETLEIFKEQITALSSAGPDVIILETFSDIKELKIAVIAAREVCNLPIQAQLTFTETGATISGTSPEAAVTALTGLGVEIIGVNCSLGPKELLPVVKRISEFAKSDTFISVLPNAGLPEIENGKTIYRFEPSLMAEYAKEYYKLGINLIGGCCGTNPDHIKAIAKVLKNKKPIKRRKDKSNVTVSSRTCAVEFKEGDAPYIIGERINPSRRKDLTDELLSRKTSIIRAEAKEQVGAGACLLDVNISAPGVDEKDTMRWVVDCVLQTVSAPLVIDTTNITALESGLKEYVGKPIVNSVNGEKKKIKEILPLVKKYGASVIALTMDDKGIPMSLKKRIAIAGRIIKEANKIGIRTEDILVDFLTLTAGANPESTEITLSAVREAKKRGWNTVLGVSNVSYGLPNRPVVNSTFFALALREGLTAAIINPKDIKMQEVIAAYKALFGGHKIVQGVENKLIPENNDPLYTCILTGDKGNVLDCLENYIKQNKDPFLINDKILIPALTEVGRRFEKGEYFLPQLLLSAEAMQRAVNRLEQLLPETNKKEGANVLMATVKGDLHDIGKNIVSSVLKNFGFNVVDLGKDVSFEKIIETIENRKIDVVGLSALMTTTMGQMEIVINEIKKRGISIPTVIGGAVVTSNYAKKIGASGYAKDAIGAVNEIKRILAK
jgi:5-methyltetrahydrofolate--homocysteine methyltransferase